MTLHAQVIVNRYVYFLIVELYQQRTNERTQKSYSFFLQLEHLRTARQRKDMFRHALLSSRATYTLHNATHRKS